MEELGARLTLRAMEFQRLDEGRRRPASETVWTYLTECLSVSKAETSVGGMILENGSNLEKLRMTSIQTGSFGLKGNLVHANILL